MEIENKNTFERYVCEGLNLFLGAGFSLLASDKKNRPLPLGDNLKKELLTEFPGSPAALQLSQLYTLISRSKKTELDRYIKSRFVVETYNNKYNNLEFVNIKNIFTTNVDDLLESVFQGNPNKYLNNACLNGASIRDRIAIDCFYLHGNISDEESTLVFSDLDIASAFSRNSYWNYLKSSMDKYPTLFWGYALRDSGILQTFG